jgi:cobalt-precorrin 5A hydrolase/precorrin-3B C17-methyltransferase
MSENKLSLKSIRKVATIDVKKGEASLSHLAQSKNLEVEFFPPEDLAKADFSSPPSPLAYKWVGAPSVCEAAALLSSGASSLLVPKTKLGDITLAIARIPLDKAYGRLFLVGLGPGDPDYLTPRARKALSESDVIVGYRTYIELLGEIASGKEVLSTEMGEEIKRAERAISLARQGKTVSLVSGGDPGLYGMAGLVMEMLRFKEGAEFSLEVIPGIPALCGASSLLGAPLTSDFACISLSDRLTSWEDIERHLESSAQGDMVIVLYNPRSQGRRHELSKARDILLKYRGGSTPVGVADNVYRQGQRITITDIDHMLDLDIGMSSTIIIGNSSTFALDRWMVTPRGYGKKYNLGRS